ncbi:hypothetical protein EMIHUDRAFT_114078 [Emiliania huxleyi CCMP1516]|uniref:Prolyl 4-hydroxylase alpha subunit domain-containing protein n=2 Tax=Emiliania huxleyi TaxID=2903 RepID=A0A0D3JZ54_EMIH1|nr:hypothetical protein EMIHUDRAFT_114078 [Emiliania huxleyi CCMP1516]EOD28789.1 hypothetical protein EMIHUDRAFT_114078 [Emiliania huxleyi CCMP1516]|eukprot:XP_005781218.1 hypothetical protein EMIHUDRAFT_114078 [Emiliania huxleyi CCMP1516]
MAEAVTVSLGALTPEALAAHDTRVGSVTAGEALELGVPLCMLQGSIPQELIERGRSLGLEPPPALSLQSPASSAMAAAATASRTRPADIPDADDGDERWRRLANRLASRRSEPLFMHLGRGSPMASCVALARGHPMHLSLLHKDPRIVLVRNFLSPAEAAAVVALARRSGRTWLRSSGGGEYRHEDTVEDETEAADGADAEEGEAPPADETRRVSGRSNRAPKPSCRMVAAFLIRRRVSGRSNRWCCVGSEHAVLAAAVERACWLTGLTAAHAEEAGQQYGHHLDHFTSRDVNCAGAGGQTHFPLAGREGLRVPPVCGSALLWHNIDKWGMNIWLRQRPRGGACGEAAPSGGVVATDGEEAAGGSLAARRVPAPPMTSTGPKAKEAETLRERN